MQARKDKTGNKNFIGLRVKLLLGFTVIFSIVFLALFYWFTSISLTNAWTDIRERLVTTTVGGAKGVNGDELASLAVDGKPNAAGFSDDPRYLHLLDWLDQIHQIEPRAWPYLYVPGEQAGDMLFMVDLGAKYDPTRSAKFLEIGKNSSSMYAGLSGLSLEPDENSRETYTDKWGSWISAYTPVYNSGGKIVGALGVDFEAGYVDDVMAGIRNNVLLVFLITYPALFILVYLISRTLSRPITALTQLAGEVGEGNYEVDFSAYQAIKFPDEVSSLANVFNIMAAKIARRELSLRKQVEELKIEVDESKRVKQVNEIVESDFFRDLQTRAQEMRARKLTREEPPGGSEKEGLDPMPPGKLDHPDV